MQHKLNCIARLHTPISPVSHGHGAVVSSDVYIRLVVRVCGWERAAGRWHAARVSCLCKNCHCARANPVHRVSLREIDLIVPIATREDGPATPKIPPLLCDYLHPLPLVSSFLSSLLLYSPHVHIRIRDEPHGRMCADSSHQNNTTQNFLLINSYTLIFIYNTYYSYYFVKD